MTKKDFLNIIKDIPDNTLIELKDNRSFILPNFTYPNEWKVSINNNIIQIEINK